MTVRIASWLGAAMAVLVAAPAPAQEQAWPARAIRVVSPMAAGGAADVLGRAVANELSADLRQPVVVENRGGGGGIVAAGLVARAAPDGYTLLLGTAGAMTITPVLTRDLPYDPIADFTPLTIAVESPICLVVNKSLHVDSVAALVAYARAHPGALTFGSSGTNSSQHLAGELLKGAAGIDMVHVPYRGGNPAMTDLLAGRIPVLFATLSTTLPHLDGGAIKILAMVEARRAASQPQIPTIGETVAGYALPASWIGFLAPAGLPPALTARMNAALVKAITAPTVRPLLAQSGFEVVTSTPAEFAATLRAAIERYRRITVDAGITAN
jgi:tripartite-type tricarboxylate transporter receptor subunit TctC